MIGHILKVQVRPGPRPQEGVPVSTFLHVLPAFALPVIAVGILFTEWFQKLVNASGGDW